jgi:hypothetical protein
MFNKNKTPTPAALLPAEVVPTLNKQIESLKGENKALKQKQLGMFELTRGHESVKQLQELLLVAKIEKGLNDKTLEFDLKSSIKAGGDMAVEIINAKTKAKVATARIRGLDKRTKHPFPDYEFEVKAVTLTMNNDTVDVKVPQQWLRSWFWDVNQLITDWANAQTEQASKALDKALKTA